MQLARQEEIELISDKDAQEYYDVNKNNRKLNSNFNNFNNTSYNKNDNYQGNGSRPDYGRRNGYNNNYRNNTSQNNNGNNFNNRNTNQNNFRMPNPNNFNQNFGNCFNCGKPGHRAHVCRSAQQFIANNKNVGQPPTRQNLTHSGEARAAVICTFCNRVGHSDANCYRKLNNGFNQMNINNNNNNQINSTNNQNRFNTGVRRVNQIIPMYENQNEFENQETNNSGNDNWSRVLEGPHVITEETLQNQREFCTSCQQ